MIPLPQSSLPECTTDPRQKRTPVAHSQPAVPTSVWSEVVTMTTGTCTGRPIARYMRSVPYTSLALSSLYWWWPSLSTPYRGDFISVISSTQCYFMPYSISLTYRFLLHYKLILNLISCKNMREWKLEILLTHDQIPWDSGKRNLTKIFVSYITYFD